MNMVTHKKNSELRSATKTDIRKLIAHLGNVGRSGTVFVGFDGFVDKIQKAVKKKKDGQNIFFNSIEEFSKHLGSLSGKSGQIELVTTRTKAGGNAPILSAALAELNIKSFCIGAMGFPSVGPLFQGLTPMSEISSINSPGNSQAIEFNDGKIILSDLSSFTNYDWGYVKKNAGLDNLRNTIELCNVVALVDWSNLPNATNIWQGLLDDVIKVGTQSDFCFLFDLCDPSKKDAAEINEILKLISSFTPYGKVTLALNENETRKIGMALNHNEGDQDGSSQLADIGRFIYDSMEIDTLLIHPIDRALAFQKNQIIELRGRLVKEPKVQTGGGDNFNAGYCLGLLTGMSIDQCMLLSIVTAGVYVQNGKSPSVNDLIHYLNNWEMEIEKHEDLNAVAV